MMRLLIITSLLCLFVGSARAQQTTAVGSAGNVNGPASATSGDIATFNGTTGKIIQDSGILPSSLAPLASPAFTGTVTAAAISATGALSLTPVNGNGGFTMTPSTPTNAAAIELLNTGGTYIFGAETSTGGNLVGGTSGYDGVVSTGAFGSHLRLAVEGVIQATVGTNGLTLATMSTATGSFVCGLANQVLSVEAATCVASDRRVKNDLGVITPEAGAAFISGLADPHEFTFKKGYGPGGDHYGWFAQDIETKYPDLVSKAQVTDLTPDGEHVFDKAEIGPQTTAAVKYLLTHVAALEACHLAIVGHCWF